MHNTIKGKTLILVGIIFILSNCIPNAFGSTKGNIDNRTTFYSSWSQVAKLLPGDGSSGDFFGSVSFDGNTAFIGSPKDDDNGVDSGSVYVFTNTSGTWVQNQKLVASDGAAGDWFGVSVSVCGDTALIGACFDDDNGVDSGSAYIFTSDGTTWTQQQKLLASDGTSYDKFGYSVALDENTALVGAEFISAYVFIHEEDGWSQQAILTPSGGATYDALGNPVAISNDTALFGTYVFTVTSGNWSQQAHLIGSDTQPYDHFGWSGDLDGNTAVIGAPFDDDVGVNSGTVFVFTRNGDTWSQQAKLHAFDGYDSDLFGFSVSIDEDQVFVGAADKNGGRGAGYGFLRQGTEWIEEGKATASDGAPSDYFGWSIDLKSDIVVIGAHYDDDQGPDSGSAYVFIKTENQPPMAGFSWTPQNPPPNQQITFNASASHDPDGKIILYAWDWNNDGVYDESQSYPTTTHTWATIGNYPVTLRITDDDGVTGTVTKSVIVVENDPPAPPTITGPAKGKVKVATAYNFTTIDPNGNDVFYFIDWGDDTNSSWIGPYPSGDTIAQSHTWTIKGTYTIKAKAKDSFGNESDWDTLSVTMPLLYGPPHFRFLNWFLGRFPNTFPILHYLFRFN
jgi:PKD repeat protein